MFNFIAGQATEILGEMQYVSGTHSPWFVAHSRPEWIPNQIPVFTYHGVEPDRFDQELRFLVNNGYRTVGSEDFHRFLTGGRKPAGKEVLLTFDDGLETVWKYGAPLLKRYGFQAIAFVVPRYVGRSRYLTWEEMERMQESGLLDIQSHTLSHNSDICSKAESLDALEHELSESKLQIENHLPGHCVEHLCYPKGIGCQQAIDMSRRLGYKTNFWGARTDRTLNRAGDDPYKVVRVKHDYILRLPGVGRRAMVSILSDKALRRIKGKTFEF